MKKVMALIILVSLIANLIINPFYVSAETKEAETEGKMQKLIFEYTTRENGYEAYLEKHSDKSRPDKEIIIEGGDYSAAEGDNVVLTSYEGVEGNMLQTAEKGYAE